VVVATHQDGVVGAIVESIVERLVSHAVDADRRAIGTAETAVVVNVAILDDVSACREGLAVPTCHRDPALSEVEEVAAHDAVIGSSRDADAIRPESPQGTSRRGDLPTSLNLDTGAA
jgi:hypothetical protein